VPRSQRLELLIHPQKSRQLVRREEKTFDHHDSPSTVDKWNTWDAASRAGTVSVHSEVAQRLGTTERFPRRLVEERRIEFQRFGRHVRIAESALNAYIESCTVAQRGRKR
jgi:excisionase family DNA binding protein